MAVAQIPSMPSIPNVAQQYSDLGRQVADVGNKFMSDFKQGKSFFESEQGKVALIDAIKKEYPQVSSMYPDAVLKQMDNKELAQRLSAVVVLQNSVTSIKEIDPLFSPVNVSQMYAQVFNNPSAVTTVVDSWTKKAEANKAQAEKDQANGQLSALQQGINKGATEGAPATPEMIPLTGGMAKVPNTSPISDADLQAQTQDLVSGNTTQKPEMPSMDMFSSVKKVGEGKASGNPYLVGQQKAGALMDVGGGSMNREQAMAAISDAGINPSKVSKENMDTYKESFTPWDKYAYDNYRKLSLAERKERGRQAMQRGLADQSFKERMLMITAAISNGKAQQARQDLYAEAEKAKAKAKMMKDSGVAGWEEQFNLANALTTAADDQTDNMVTLQEMTAGLLSAGQAKYPEMVPKRPSPSPVPATSKYKMTIESK